MSKIKFFCLILFLIGMNFHDAKANSLSLLDSANSNYEKENFSKAVIFYDSLLKLGFSSTDLHYNIANAYFKNRQIAHAILHFEKAVKIDPSNEDAIYNLKIANEKTVDKVKSIPELFIYRWWKNIYNLNSADVWSKIFIAFLLLSLGGFGIYFFSNQLQFRKLGFYGAIFNLSLGLICLILAIQQKAYIESSTAAIIIEPTVNIVSSPSEGSSQLFVLHEGTKVTIKDQSREWLKVALPNGNEGWIKSALLAEI